MAKKQKPNNIIEEFNTEELDISDLPFEIAQIISVKPKITKNDLILIKTVCDYAKEINRMQHVKDLLLMK